MIQQDITYMPMNHRLSKKYWLHSILHNDIPKFPKSSLVKENKSFRFLIRELDWGLVHQSLITESSF